MFLKEEIILNKPFALNFLGGPGLGKSTMAADIFAELKKKGVSCELVHEYAKAKVWEESLKILDNQVYVFGKQYNSMHRLKDKVDCIITDAPLVNNILYNKSYENLDNLVLECIDQFQNINIFLTRDVVYQETGRIQKLKEAQEYDEKLKSILRDKSIDFVEISPLKRDEIIDYVMSRMSELT